MPETWSGPIKALTCTITRCGRKPTLNELLYGTRCLGYTVDDRIRAYVEKHTFGGVGLASGAAERSREGWYMCTRYKEIGE